MLNNTIETSTNNGIVGHCFTKAALIAQGQKTDNWEPIKEEPGYSRRQLKVVCVGAGLGGLVLAHKIKHELKLADFIDLVIYEKNPDVGGTWYENRYPGVACDVPAHVYDFLFELNPDWSQFYAPGAEIQQYIKRTVQKHNLDEHIQFNSKLIESVWHEDSSKWKFRVEQNGMVIEDEADIFVNAGGILNKWRWPDIESINDFQGTLLHTANWDASCNWANKRIAVIGNGSSAIQCVPTMQRKAAKVVNYVRSPTWISQNLGLEHTKDGHNFSYTEEEKAQFREDPNALFEYRRKLEAGSAAAFLINLKGHPYSDGLAAACKATMTERLEGQSELAEKLIPKFSPGCRRLTPGDGYIEAFREPNCSWCFESIDRITKTGILTVDGNEEEFDIIVCASGFDTNFIPSWKLVGRNGAVLTETWKESPEAFVSVHVNGMPNYFLINGPNCLIAHGPMCTALSWICDYILRFVQKMATEDIRSIDVKKEVVDDYNVWAQEMLKRTSWADKCHSWYKNNKSEGQVTAVHSGTFLHMKDCFDNIGFEHFDIVYNSKNRFRFLGNGTSLLDHDAKESLRYLNYWRPVRQSSS